MPPIGERVIRLKIDFGNSQQDAGKLQESLKGIGDNSQEASKSILSFGQQLGKTALIITGITAGVALLVKSLQSGLMNPARWGAFGAMVIAAFDKLKVGFHGLIGALEAVHKHTTIMDSGLAAVTKPLGPFIARLTDLGLAAETVALVLGTIGGPTALKVAAGFSLMAKGAGATVASITALTYAVGALATSIGNKLENATNSWLEAGLEFQKQQFGLEIAVKGFGRAADGAAIDVKKLIKDIQDISAETGVAATEIKQGVNVMYEMSKVTHLTGDQINTLIRYMADFATVRGKEFSEVVYAIDQSFRGWHRSASGLGLALDDATVKMEAAKHGWAGASDSMDANTETALRYKTALAAMTVTLGASKAQLDILPGVIRKLNGEFQQIHNQLGVGVSKYWYPYYNILLKITEVFRSVLGPNVLQAIGYISAMAGSALQAVGAIFKWGSALVILVSGIRLLQVAMAGLGKFVVIEKLAKQFFELGTVSKLLDFSGTSKSAAALAENVGHLGQRLSTFRGILGLVGEGIGKFVTGTLRTLAVAAIKPLLIMAAIAAAIWVLVKAFQVIEARTHIFSKLLAILTDAFNYLVEKIGGNKGVNDVLNFFATNVLANVVAVVHLTVAAILALIIPFVALSYAVAEMLVLWNKLMLAMGGGTEQDVKIAEQTAAKLEKQLGNLGNALVDVIQPSEVFGESMKKNEAAIVEANKAAGALSEDQVAEIDKLIAKSEALDRSNIWEDLSRKVLLLKNQLSGMGVTDLKEQEKGIKKLGRETAAAQFQALAPFIEFLGKSNEAMQNELEVLDKMLEKNAVGEVERLDILNKVFTEKYNERNNIVRQSVQERINAETDLTKDLLELQGNTGGAINLEREKAENNIRIELEQKLMDIKKSGFEVSRRSKDAEATAVVQLVQNEKEAFEKRKQFILDFSSRQKDAVSDLAEAQASTTETALSDAGKVYEADKFNLERKGLLIKRELSDRILAIKSMNISAVESEHLITLAQEKEATQRKQLALEEAAARKKAIREAGSAATGFSIGAGKSDLQIIKEKGIRELTPEEEQQIQDEKKQRKEQQAIERARNPLAFGSPGSTFTGRSTFEQGRSIFAPGPAAPLTAVGFEEVQKLRDFRTQQRAGVQAQVAGGFLTPGEGSAQLATIDQALGEKIKDLSDQFPEFTKMFEKYGQDIASGKEDVAVKTEAQKALDNQIRATDINTTALNLLSDNIKAFNISIDPFLKQLRASQPNQLNLEQKPLDVNGKKIQVDPLNPTQPPNARTGLELPEAKPNPALDPFYSSAAAAEKFPSLVDAAMLAAQDKFIERLKIMTDEGNKGIGKLGISLYQTIIDQMDTALDGIKTRV